jgi:hypothetical protein
MLSNRAPSYILSIFPNLPSHRVMGKLLTNVDGMLAGIEKHLAPIIEERLEQERTHGPNWTDKPVSRHFHSSLKFTMPYFAPAYRMTSSPGCSKELQHRKKNPLPEIWPGAWSYSASRLPILQLLWASFLNLVVPVDLRYEYHFSSPFLKLYTSLQSYRSICNHSERKSIRLLLTEGGRRPP